MSWLHTSELMTRLVQKPLLSHHLNKLKKSIKKTVEVRSFYFDTMYVSCSIIRTSIIIKGDVLNDFRLKRVFSYFSIIS